MGTNMPLDLSRSMKVIFFTLVMNDVRIPAVLT